MPKLIINLTEARDFFADRHSVLSSQIEFNFDLPTPYVPPVYASIRAEEMTAIMREATILVTEYNNYRVKGVYNKIAAIKALRTVRQCGLKEAKDAIELYFAPL